MRQQGKIILLQIKNCSEQMAQNTADSLYEMPEIHKSPNKFATNHRKNRERHVVIKIKVVLLSSK